METNYHDLKSNLLKTLRNDGISDRKVLDAISDIPREEFVSVELKHKAYENCPLNIGYEQTISQPFIVAYMIQALNLKPTDRVLEVGTGCGYNAAVMSRLVDSIYSLEIVKPLFEMANENLERLKIKNVITAHRDGYKGWAEKSPFDAIILTACPEEIPETLLEQLAEGGRLIAPVGSLAQELILIVKKNGELIQKNLLAVRFVPMTKELK